jgi:PIN domain nuclease of toxin-antitoxin system
MRILVDTNIFIWWDSEPDALPNRSRSYLENVSNTIVLSVVSIWEFQIKHQLRKLTLRLPIEDLIRDHQQQNSVEILPITLEHALYLGRLPTIHKDPFDRLLITQAKVEGIALLTADRVFSGYDIPVLD